MRPAVATMLAAEGAVPDQKLRLGLEMVVRACGPRISCSVHVTRMRGK